MLSALASAPAPLLDDAIPAVPGGFAAPSAWLALWRGEAWVCWQAAPDCWQRLELAGLVDLTSLRAEFVDRSTLVLGDRSEATWQIVRGDPTPRSVAWTVNPRNSPHVHACGPDGALPVADDDHLQMISRPCADAPEHASLCVRPGMRMRLRPASPLRLSLGIAVQSREHWRDGSIHALATSGVQLLAIIGVGLDLSGWMQQRRERADLQAQARPDLRALPALHSRGPLASAEREALGTALCGGAR